MNIFVQKLKKAGNMWTCKVLGSNQNEIIGTIFLFGVRNTKEEAPKPFEPWAFCDQTHKKLRKQFEHQICLDQKHAKRIDINWTRIFFGARSTNAFSIPFRHDLWGTRTTARLNHSKITCLDLKHTKGKHVSMHSFQDQKQCIETIWRIFLLGIRNTRIAPNPFDWQAIARSEGHQKKTSRKQFESYDFICSEAHNRQCGIICILRSSYQKEN